jgi:uncharacterized protein DUF4203
MLPVSYETPVAIALVLGGIIACFAGYRLFRMVLAIYGFFIGAMLASSIMASSNALGMVVAALVGGVIGSIVLFFAYFVGIALVGAGLGAIVAHFGWSQVSATEQPLAVLLICVVIGTVVALVLQRYVIIVSTAFLGAWTVVVGALALDRGTVRASSADVWILYPFAPASGPRWVLIAWIALGILGTAVQMVISRKR